MDSSAASRDGGLPCYPLPERAEIVRPGDRPRPLPGWLAALCVAAAAACGWQVVGVLAWGVWGRPSHPVEWVALLGAAALGVGGVFGRSGRRAGAAVAGGGCLALWEFYAPALADAGAADFFLPALVPPALLAAATALLVVDARLGERPDAEPGAAADPPSKPGGLLS